MRGLALRFGCALAVLLTCVSLDGATVSRQHAETFERKVAQISDPKGPGAQARRTSVTEDEVNSWFAFHSQPRLPEGIASPQVTMVGAGRVTGQAIVDLGAVARRRSSGSWLDPWALVGGKLPLSVTGTLQTREGVGRFALESATLGGIPVPKPVLQELLGLYSRSDERPRGVSLDDTFALPADIRSVEVGRGVAVVVQ